MKKIINIITKNIPEIIFVLGVFFIVFSTFLLNFIAGMYVLGSILAMIGIFLARWPIKQRKGG